MIYNSNIVGGTGGASDPITVPLPVEITKYNLEINNYTEVGNPTISNAVLTDCDASNYIKTKPLTTLPEKYNWYFKITTPASYSDSVTIMCSHNNDDSVNFEIDGSGKLYMFNRPRGSGYYEGRASIPLNPNTVYYIKLAFKTMSSSIKAYSSLDGIVWNEEFSCGSYAMDDTEFKIGVDRRGRALGTPISLRDIYITDENDNVIWNLYKDYSTGKISLYDFEETPAEATEGQVKGYKNDVYATEDGLVACKTNTKPEDIDSNVKTTTSFYLDSTKTLIVNPKEGLNVTVTPTEEEGLKNFTVSGSPTISNKVLSNITTSDYVYIPSAIPASFETFELYTKIITPSSIGSSDYPIISDSDINKDIFLEGSSKKICQWNNSTKDSGTTVLNDNTEYALKIVYASENYSVYVDDVLQFTTSRDVFKGLSLRIGRGYSGGSQYFTGSIDLSDMYIKVDDELWWKPYSDPTTGDITVDEGHIYVDETVGYLTVDEAITSECPDFVVHSEDFEVAPPVTWEQPTATSTIGGTDFGVAADSTHSGNIVNAFNGTDSWHASTPLPHWVKWYNPEPITVKSFTHQTADNYYGHHPIGAWELQYSDDGSSWTTAVSGTNADTSDNTDITLDMSTNTVSSKYWRLYITSELGSGGYIQIKKIRIGAEQVSTNKLGYISLIKPTASTIGVVATGIRNPSAAYAGSVITPIDLSKAVYMDETVTKITGSGNL